MRNAREYGTGTLPGTGTVLFPSGGGGFTDMLLLPANIWNEPAPAIGSIPLLYAGEFCPISRTGISTSIHRREPALLHLSYKRFTSAS
ncbi:hypothetical protein [Kamptonema formosum]|uniref:hypothetical protein n=1 Tax=Kamptonema formosum TaxID=331992 RepID=UPI00034B246C|nr:hypothetical protein [Oscillatoria sp. PCC 10802]